VLQYDYTKGETNILKTGRGVKQRCCSSPVLFNLHSEFDVHGSVHYNINRIEMTKKCDRVVEFIILILMVG